MEVTAKTAQRGVPGSWVAATTALAAASRRRSSARRCPGPTDRSASARAISRRSQPRYVGSPSSIICGASSRPAVAAATAAAGSPRQTQSSASMTNVAGSSPGDPGDRRRGLFEPAASLRHTAPWRAASPRCGRFGRDRPGRPHPASGALPTIARRATDRRLPTRSSQASTTRARGRSGSLRRPSGRLPGQPRRAPGRASRRSCTRS